MYILDTNICIYVIKKKPISVIQNLRTKRVDEVGISSITLAELEYGVSKSNAKEKNRLALAEFMVPFEIFNFDGVASSIYGDIRCRLEKRGQPIGPLDTLIAAHAISLDAILVTNNMKEFERVDSLKCETWT